MPAGCRARPLTWLTVRVFGSILAAEALGAMLAAAALGAGLAGEEVTQAFVLVTWRVPCTPVSIMLTAP